LHSPLNIFFCYATPTLPADGEFFSLDEYVQFDVFAFTIIFQRILTMLQYDILRPGSTALVETAFKARGETACCHSGGFG
jgi:hypothetical protein